MASKIFPALLIAVVIWLGTLIWRDSSEGLRQQHTSPEPAAQIIPASARPPASDFVLRSIDGETVQLTAFRGKSPVVLNFFATWCVGCREELPRLVSLHEKYRAAGLEV